MWRRPLASYVTNYVMYVHGFPDVFDARDVLRIEREDAYVERFFMHMYDLPGSQEDNAVNMAVTTFKWRKEMKVYGEF